MFDAVVICCMILSLISARCYKEPFILAAERCVISV